MAELPDGIASGALLRRAVAPRGSFNRAAQQLHLTQPAVNRQVQNSGAGIGVALTAVSEQFYGEARDLLTRAGHAVQRVRAQSADATLRTGYITSSIEGVLPRAIQSFQAASSQVRMEFKEFLREA